MVHVCLIHCAVRDINFECENFVFHSARDQCDLLHRGYARSISLLISNRMKINLFSQKQQKQNKKPNKPKKFNKKNKQNPHYAVMYHP